MSIDPTEIATVMALPPEDRYEFFIDQVIETGTIWGLVKESWAMYYDESQGFQLLPFWSDPAFAEANRQGEWADYELKQFNLHEFSLESANALKESNLNIAVFKSPQDNGQIVNPVDLQTLLIEKYQRQIN